MYLSFGFDPWLSSGCSVCWRRGGSRPSGELPGAEGTRGGEGPGRGGLTSIRRAARGCPSTTALEAQATSKIGSPRLAYQHTVTDEAPFHLLPRSLGLTFLFLSCLDKETRALTFGHFDTFTVKPQQGGGHSHPD